MGEGSAIFFLFSLVISLVTPAIYTSLHDNQPKKIDKKVKDKLLHEKKSQKFIKSCRKHTVRYSVLSS